jgi:predicted nuclease of predicted toxin-antitoxin system
MRFLADESCDFAVVRALREAGHDVVAIAEVFRGIDDEQVIVKAKIDKRIVKTEDKDFGQLVYAGVRQASGVIFIRFPATARTSGVPLRTQHHLRAGRAQPPRLLCASF